MTAVAKKTALERRVLTSAIWVELTGLDLRAEFSTLHYAVADYWPAKRLMHRLTIETDDLGGSSK